VKQTKPYTECAELKAKGSTYLVEEQNLPNIFAPDGDDNDDDVHDVGRVCEEAIWGYSNALSQNYLWR
jgi:hypothetical protein